MSLRRTLVAGACAVALAASAPSVAGTPTYDYVFNTNLLTQPAAEAHCVSLGGHLTTIASQAEEDLVRAAIPVSHKYNMAANANPKVPETKFWIGGTDQGSEGTWRWLDGTPFTRRTAPRVSNAKWEGDHFIGIEPNNYQGKQHWLAASTYQGAWDDVQADYLYTSMCKIKKNGHFCYPRDCCTEFQQYIDGEAQAIQPVAPGTVCKNGGLVWPSECTTPCSGPAVPATPAPIVDVPYTGLRCVPGDCCNEYRWVVNGLEYAPQPTAPGTVCKTQEDGSARMVLAADCGSVCPIGRL